jgi:3-deoxy-D-manno-octulosonic-acid transferase
MNSYHFAYNFLSSALVPIVLPLVWCYAGRDPQLKASLVQRMGYAHPGPETGAAGRPLIWIHAVSVGEVKASEAVIRALDDFSSEKARLLLTTTTQTGQLFARRHLGHRAAVRFAPLDLWWVTDRFLAAYRPDMLICMETEIWPNWIAYAHRAGIKTVFLNGRISGRSIDSYLKVRPLLSPMLEKVDAFSMISDIDARRVVSLGAPAHRVHVNGNAKMDTLEADGSDFRIDRLRRRFSLSDSTPVFIAGSVRGEEADMVLEAYLRMAEKLPDLFFILAPRHIENSSRIAHLAGEKGIACQRRTELGHGGGVRRAPVLILDTIGELRDVYGIASVVFGGASLVPLGGQNVLEAAIWGKPVLFGPYMDDFTEARNLLEACGGGICVENAGALVERAVHLLTHPDDARRMGNQARKAVLANQGAARRHARVAVRTLSGTRL